MRSLILVLGALVSPLRGVDHPTQFNRIPSLLSRLLRPMNLKQRKHVSFSTARVPKPNRGRGLGRGTSMAGRVRRTRSKPPRQPNPLRDHLHNMLSSGNLLKATHILSELESTHSSQTIDYNAFLAKLGERKRQPRSGGPKMFPSSPKSRGNSTEGQLDVSPFEILERMKEAGVLRDEFTYGAAMRCAGGNLTAAVGLLEGARADGVAVNEVMYLILIRVAVASGVSWDDRGSTVGSGFLSTGLQGIISEMNADHLECTSIIYNAAMSALNARGDFQGTIRAYQALLDSGEAPDGTSFSYLAVAKNGLGDEDGAMAAAVNGSRVPRKSSVMAFVHTIRERAKRRQWKSALDMLRKMDEKGVNRSLNAYTAVIRYCPAPIAEALAYECVEMREVVGPCDIALFNAAIAACGQRSWQRALRLFELAKRLNVTPDALTFNTLINALSGPNQWRKALEMGEDMRDENIPWDSHTLTGILSALGNAGSWQRSLAFLREMQKTGIECMPQHTSAIIKAASRSQDWQSALRLIIDNPSHIDSVALNSVISACAFARQWSVALALSSVLSPSPPHILHPNPCDSSWEGIGDIKVTPTTSIVTSLILALWEREGKWTSARENLDNSVSTTQTSIDSYNFKSPAAMGIDGGEISVGTMSVPGDALEVDHSYDEDPTDDEEHDEETESWRWRGARNLFNWAIEKTQDLEGFRVDARCFQSVLTVLAHHARWRDALKVLNQAEDLDVWNRQLYPLGVAACLRAQRWIEALETFDKLHQKPPSHDQKEDNARMISPDDLALGLRAMAVGRQWERAFSLFKSQSHLATQFSAGSHLSRARNKFGVSARTLAETLRSAIVSKWAHALRMAMEKGGVRANSGVFSALVDSVGTAKGGLLTEEILDIMLRDGVRKDVSTLAASIRATAAAQRWERAMQLYDESWKIAEMTVSASSQNSQQEEGGTTISEEIQQGLCAALWACDAASRYEAGVGIFSNLPGNVSPGPTAFRLGIKNFAGASASAERRGDWQRALSLLRSPILSKSPGLITGAIRAMGKQGKWERALQLYRSMGESSLRASRAVLSSVASALCAAEEDEKFVEFLRELRSARDREDSADSRPWLDPKASELKDKVSRLIDYGIIGEAERLEQLFKGENANKDNNSDANNTPLDIMDIL